jgi:hypothetical protein
MVMDAAVFEDFPELESLGLSRRTQNALLQAGLVQGSRVRSTTVGSLARLRSFGAMSLLDALTANERTLSSAVSPGRDPQRGPTRVRSRAVRDAAYTLERKRWAKSVTSDDPRIGGALATLHPAATNARDAAGCRVASAERLRRLTLEDELDEVIGVLTRSTDVKQALQARTGLGGAQPVTLEAAGRRLGVTRERVRQLEQELRKKVAERNIWTPVLDRTLRLMKHELPASVVQVTKRLIEEGLIGRSFSIPGLIAAAELFGRDLPFSYQPQLNSVARPGAWNSATSIRTAAHRLVEHWGATTVSDVEARISEEGLSVEPTLVIAVLESIDGFIWLDPERAWFWIRGGRNRLLNQVEKILTVAGSIEIGELRAGVGRLHRMKGFHPPREVLAALCESSGLYTRDGNRIVGGPELPDWQDVLGKNECTIVDLLFEHGPLMRREDLEPLAVGERGLNRSSFYVYLTYSPVLERYAPGVWGLRGADVSAAEVDALIPPRVRHQVLQDHGWTAEGLFWAAFKISPAAESTGVLGAPAPIRSIARGPYRLYSADKRPVGTLVIEQAMWGLSPFFRRWGVEAGDFVVITLDLAARRAVIATGDEELLLRFQQAE